ncbi:MAG: hypothetical protein M3388_15565 [Acidobacteriota bacterium]|nr:hypothetical protein [Acidobacteriota bacterium]
MKTLIKNGRIVTTVDDYRADFLNEDETVSIIGKGGLLRQRDSHDNDAQFNAR